MRRGARAPLRDGVADWVAGRTSGEVLDALEWTVPSAPVHDAADVADDEHVAARELRHEVVQSGADERVAVAGTPIKLSETPPEPGRRAPLLDEHRDAILNSVEATGDDRVREFADLAPAFARFSVKTAMY